MTDKLATAVEIRVELSPRVQFSMQQNDVPVVSTLHIENRSSEPIRDLDVCVTAEPEFAHIWSAHVAEVAPESTFNLEKIDLELSPGFLGDLTERLRGEIQVEVRRAGDSLSRKILPVELLARDEWAGLSSLPEILAAFVLPNDPAVQRVLRAAAEIVGNWTGDPSLNGYQSKDGRRVYQMAAAIYAALQQQDITYVNPPASFEDEGQRVRLPEQILGSRMATCLDMALFAAACLEQAGIHSLVVLARGHAVTGFWVQEECFTEPAVDDRLRLRKRVDLREVEVFDPTGVTTRPAYNFQRAVTEARYQLSSDDRFLCAIDVRRARKGHIRPLPQRAERDAKEREEQVAGALPEGPVAPDVSGIAGPQEPPAAEDTPERETPATRLDRWQRKLLDLSLRNRLLNFRDTKKTLPILCPDLGRLEDLLADGVVFQVLPKPHDLGASDPRDAATHRRRTGNEAMDELLLEELASRRLRSATSREELDRRMTEIYRAARLGLEEGGASALYLSIGFLSWYETDTSETQRLAPILLLPLELRRPSVREGFSLRLADDDPRINITLLEMLKQDHGLVIPGLDPLPEDESGLDVPKILQTVRRAVRDVDRWDVLDEARIGLLSFTKFLMWRDLNERLDQLMTNPIVEHLVNRPEHAFDPDGAFPNSDRLDDERSPVDTFCPLPADSSQLAAVFAAAEGRSFVLEGPPGTGKSQTITNLIAHCLTEGKRILFVSEKMAALDVVHKRLVAAGLGRYCLELHSNKSKKREVVDQLQESLTEYQARGEEEWEREARRLSELRNELNAYVRALHKRRHTGETVFQVTSRLIGLREVPRVELHWSDSDALDADELIALRDLVQRLATAGATCGGVKGHPWASVGKEAWTPGWEGDVHRSVETLASAAQQLAECASLSTQRLGLREGALSLSELVLIHNLADHLMASPGAPIALLTCPDWDDAKSRIAAWIDQGQERDRLRSVVSEHYDRGVLALDLDDLQQRHRRVEQLMWPMSAWRRRSIRKALLPVSRDGTPPEKEDIGDSLSRAIELRDAQASLDGSSAAAMALLGRHWAGGEGDWELVARVRDWADGLRGLAVRASGGDLARAASLRTEWARLALEGRELLRPDASVGAELVAYREALNSFVSARDEVARLLELDAAGVWGDEDAKDVFGRIRESVTAWRLEPHKLRDWCSWRRARADALRSNLGPLVEEYEGGYFDSTRMSEVFERSYSQWWLTAVTDAEPVLSQFFSPEQERKIEQFRELDDRYMGLTRHLIAARLAKRLPAASSSVLPNSEMGILTREVNRRRRHMSVRSLFHKIPNLLPRLKPCLLMSPMSVAQYLDANHPPFDVVVFDEASQIPVWDAVGAIARGRQAVIVGDPRQLPPTSFFQRAEDDEEEGADEVVEDLESILDDCIAARIPWLSLDWHYRSRHESLITFSNYHYYENRLLTFPSPALEGLGVSWRHVPGGVYDKGKSRTNRAEAGALVQEILGRLRDPRRAAESIGVVTFSQAQQTLIEDLLDAARGQDSDLDAYLADEREEGIFVKNLENVQGDERDVILFSICYGPDQHGRVSMNFGPMNREGGERRLNVAITRARREVVVFSTLEPEQIDLSRTRARGVRDLKGFLEYAQRGPAAIAEAIVPDLDADFDSPFEEDVYNALVKRGWEVHKQVGCARYRIDLAVVDPSALGRYLIGIECDGANYHRAKAARDRDKLREAVLRDLGWELARIWSTDWWTNSTREIEKLEAALERARNRPIERGPSREKGSSAVQVAGAPRSSATAEAVAADGQSRAAPAAGDSAQGVLEKYRPATVNREAGTQSDFYGSSSSSAIRKHLADVVMQEGPISLALAARRVASAWGFERVGARAVDRIRSEVEGARVQLVSESGVELLWPEGVNPRTYESFRVPDADGRGVRSIEDLPLEEIGAAVLHVLESHVGAPEAELIRETARLFGFQRTGRVVDERVRLGIELLARRGRVVREGTNVTVAR